MKFHEVPGLYLPRAGLARQEHGWTICSTGCGNLAKGHSHGVTSNTRLQQRASWGDLRKKTWAIACLYDAVHCPNVTAPGVPRHMLSCCCWGTDHADNVVFVDGCRDIPETEALESIALPEGTFAVELEREASATLGLDLDRMDRQNLMVVKTQPGLVSEYNKLASSEEVIKRGDRIWRVNGKTGSADELLEMLATDKKLHLILRRCKEKEVYVEKKGKTLGIQLAVTEKASCLTVEKVNPGGLVATLNEKTSEDRQIRVHDKIVAVDGIQGLAPELMKQIKEKDSFILKLFSWDIS
eukprot:s1053_g28.t1